MLNDQPNVHERLNTVHGLELEQSYSNTMDHGSSLPGFGKRVLSQLGDA